jgi:hypothetical protein
VTNKPVIFISYAHADEPEMPAEGETPWLSFVLRFLRPAVKNGIFDIWVDRHMRGGTDWEPEIEEKLRDCDIFVLLVSANSMASNYIVDKEIAIIRDRQARGDLVHFFPLLLTPTPRAGLVKVKDKNLRPRDATPFSAFSTHDRAQHMSDAADEIAELAEHIVKRRSAEEPTGRCTQPAFVHIAGLPETAYERLVGREAELKRLNNSWADRKINILSLVAEGGAGKSALVNEWLKRMQVDSYRGAEAVLGWSFYSQGTKERATSAEPFLNWALGTLGVTLQTTNVSAKGETIAEALAQRRVLLVLDGVEPLQHGLDKRQGELKDIGLRSLLRRLASMPPASTHGLVVLTSRLPVRDIARWNDGAAPVVDVEKLSDGAGVALLRDNGVWGTDKQLSAAARAFGRHPLALGLLASFLKETQGGDVRRRDHIRELLDDCDNPGHDHARRVMESYEKEWLAGRPLYQAIMYMVGLFDRPANGDCLLALRRKPPIPSLTESVVNLDEAEWRRAIARLREARLLAPLDPSAPNGLDAHPLVREWFGQRLERAIPEAWHSGHSRLFEHLRDTTQEGKTPPLEELAPLYEAIAHGCRAGRYEEAFNIYLDRICRRDANGQLAFYAVRKLGALGSELAAISCFFQNAYEAPVGTLDDEAQFWLLGEAAFSLRAQGRFAEALPAQRAQLRNYEQTEAWAHAAVSASNLREAELLVGEVAAAVSRAEQSVAYADRSGENFHMMSKRAGLAEALHASGRSEEAERLYDDAERRQKEQQPSFPLLYSIPGSRYCELLLAKGKYTAVCDRAAQTLKWGSQQYSLLSRSLDILMLGRARLGLALECVRRRRPIATTRGETHAAEGWLDEAIDGLRAAGQFDDLPLGLIARAAFRRSVGDWDRAALDLDEVEEIAEPGPMRLFLCDMAIERARLALARIEAFAPLNGLTDEGQPKPVAPVSEELKQLVAEATNNLAKAEELISDCGYHRRDEELTELRSVLRGERTFVSLPPRV